MVWDMAAQLWMGFQHKSPYRVPETDWRIWVSNKRSSHPWLQLSFSGGVLTLYSTDNLPISALLLFFSQVSLAFTYILSSSALTSFSPRYTPLFAPSVPSLRNLNCPSSLLYHLHWQLLSVSCLGSFFSFRINYRSLLHIFISRGRLYNQICRY